MNIFKTTLISFFIFLGSLSQSNAISEEKAHEFVTGLGNEAIQILTLPVEDLEARVSGFRNLLHERFDLRRISLAVLGRSARKADKKQLSRFQNALEEHIVRVYTSQLGAYKNQVFTINKVIEKENGDAFVYTAIEQGDVPSISIDWRLRERDGEPRVIDIAVEGVSLLATKRADFKALISEGGIDGLINTLEELNKIPNPEVAGSGQ